MGITLILVKSDHKTIDNKVVSPIHVKYTFKGHPDKRFPTGIYIEHKYWKPGSISPRCPNHVNIDREITKIKKEIKEIITDIIDEGGYPTPDLVKTRYKSKTKSKISKQPKFKSFWNSYNEFLIEKSKFPRSYLKTLYTLKNKLKDFEQKTNHTISFDYILDGKFERDFKYYCYELELPNQSNKKNKVVGLSNNYINKLFTHIRIFLSWCKEEKYIADIKKFKKLKEIKNDVLVYLNSTEVIRMYNFKDYDYPKTYLNVETIKDVDDRDGNPIVWNNKELIKDIFTFQCSTGARWGDIHKMNVGMFKIEKDFLTWTMGKTNDVVRVPENKVSLGIFKKYALGKSKDKLLFPKYSQQKFNLHLKEIGKDLKLNRMVKREILSGVDIREESKKDKHTWELLSSHCGRRSFVKNLLDLGTMDYWSIMKLSGHRSVESFQKYVSVTSDDLLKGKELYSKENKSKRTKKHLDDFSNEELLEVLNKRMK